MNLSAYGRIKCLAALDLEIHQMDIKTAFLNGKVDEVLYVKQPPGYVQGDGSLACRLNRALYVCAKRRASGTRRSRRSWSRAASRRLRGTRAFLCTTRVARTTPCICMCMWMTS